MPDLGQYAFEVLTSYALSIGLIGGLICLSVWRSRRVEEALHRIEKDG